MERTGVAGRVHDDDLIEPAPGGIPGGESEAAPPRDRCAADPGRLPSAEPPPLAEPAAAEDPAAAPRAARPQSIAARIQGLRPRPGGIARWRAWWDRAPDNLRGSILMIAAFVVFSVMTAAIKAIGTRVPLPQVLLLRQVIMTVLLMPLFLHDIRHALSTSRLSLQITRGLFSLMSMLFGFTAIIHVPLADATALGFSQVLFVTILAVVILKEAVGWRRWAATLIGFVGVLIMLRPTGDGLSNPYGLFAVIGALFGSGITVTVRMLAQSEKTATILLYQAIVLCLALIVPTVLWWENPTPREWLLIGLIGVVGTAGQYLITRAYQVGEAAALAPLDFVRLLIATGIGFAVFAELPSLPTFIGASIVVAATVYTVRRNAGTEGRGMAAVAPRPPGTETP